MIVLPAHRSREGISFPFDCRSGQRGKGLIVKTNDGKKGLWLVDEGG